MKEVIAKQMLQCWKKYLHL